MDIRERADEKNLLKRLKELYGKGGGGHRVLLSLAMSMFVAMTVSALISQLASIISFVWTSYEYVEDLANIIFDGCKRDVYVEELDAYLDRQLAGESNDDNGHFLITQELLNEQSDSSGFIDIWIMVVRGDRVYCVMDTDDKTPFDKKLDLDEYFPEEMNWLRAFDKAEKAGLMEGDGWASRVQGLFSMMVKKLDNDKGVEAYVGLRLDREWMGNSLRRQLKVLFILVIVIEFFVLLNFVLYVRRKISKPIGYLNLAAYDFAQRADLEMEGEGDGDREKFLAEDFFGKLPIKGKNEIVGLYTSLIKMEREIKSYIVQSINSVAEKERMGAEFDVASSLQQGILPTVSEEMKRDLRYDLYAMMRPAKAVGGDFYDFFTIDDDTLALVIADVSDKGTPASMFMMMSKILIKERALQGGTPAQILAYVNDRLCENNANSMFVTVWLGIVQLSTGVVTAASAGHEYPFVKGENGSYELLNDPHGIMCGVIENQQYEDYTIKLPPGGCIFVYTDGVAEAADTTDERFETDRIGQVLNSCPDPSMKGIVDRMISEVDSFAAGCEQFDDITMLAFTLGTKPEG